MLKYGYSIRFFVLAGIFSGAEIALPMINEVVHMPRGLFAALSFAAVCGGTIARFVAQKEVSGNED